MFEAVGFSPSAAVRALWGFAAQHADEPEKVGAFLSEACGTEWSPDEERRAKIARYHQALVAAEAFGIDASQGEPLSRDVFLDAREAYLIERLEDADAHSVISS